MKASELRIGNKAYLKLETIKDNIVTITVTDILMLEEGKTHLLPIALTEEWLLKFGFKVLNGGYYKSPYMIEVASTKTMRYTLYQGIEDLSTIEHVHQLQNLYFALTGTEL